MKKVFLCICIVLLSPILLFGILTALLYVPAVQNWLVKQGAAYASDATGMNIGVGRIALVFPLDLSIEDILVTRQNNALPQLQDTIADIGRVHIDVRFQPILDGKVLIDALEIDNAKINTADIVAAAAVKATVPSLRLTSRDIDLNTSVADIAEATVNGATVHIALNDSVPEDTTESEPTAWKVLIGNIALNNANVTIDLPGDTLTANARIGNLTLNDASLDLGDGCYDLLHICLTDGGMTYDNLTAARATAGIDPNHIAIDSINVTIDSLHYRDPDARIILSSLSLREECSGTTLCGMEGTVLMDSASLAVPALSLRTADSEISAELTMALNAFADSLPGDMHIRAQASIGKQDIVAITGMDNDIIRQYPNYPLTVTLSADGNMKRLDIAGVSVNLPTALNATASGYVANIDSLPLMQADIDIDARTGDLNFVTAAAGLTLPRGITLTGSARADGSAYATNITIKESEGTVTLDGSIDTDVMAYKAYIDVSNIDLKHFLTDDSLSAVTASATVEGRGTDPLNRSTRANVTATVDSFAYGSLDFGDMTATISLNNGNAHAEINSSNSLLDADVTADALIGKDDIAGTVSADITKADLYRLRVTDDELAVAACAHIDIAAQGDSNYSLTTNVSDLAITDPKETHRPTDIIINAVTNADTTWAAADCGDFALALKASGGYEGILAQAGKLTDALIAQTEEKTIDQQAIQSLLPTFSLHVKSGSENPVTAFLATQGIAFNDAALDLSGSPHDGLEGDLHVYTLVTDSMQIDTVKMKITQDDDGIHLFGQIRNGKDNPQVTFNTLLAGTVLERGAEMGVKYFDGNDSLGVEIGLRAELYDEGINVHLFPERPVIAYKPFNLNTDNSLKLARSGRVTADIDLHADDGTRLSVLSDSAATDMLQDITATIERLDLAEITSVIPYAPAVAGSFSGSFHIMQDMDGRLSLSSSLAADSLAYEECPIGDINSSFAYMLQDDSTHTLDASMALDGAEVMTLDGSYMTVGDGYIDATVALKSFPLGIVNGFVPDQLIGFKGNADGSLAIKGYTAAPIVDGTLNLDSAHILSVPYGVDLKADNKPINIVGSNLNLNNIALYSYNDSPLNINGNVNFATLDDIRLNIGIKADNYQLINAKQTKESIAYGKAFVGVGMMVAGSLDKMTVRGELNVLGSTDMTYILEDSPLNTDDQLKDLVTFTDFRDTTEVKVYKPTPSGMDIDLMIDIEEGARIFCALNADQTNYVDVEGGGELRLTWGDDDDDMKLTGRYTINSGEMKYELPVIPLKTFTIGEGSYVEFTGEMMNPTLNITATEEVNATVSSDGGDSRTVRFDCGVKVTQTLNNMGLEFTLDAPEDVTVKNELAAMSVEDRGKVAVTMLTTGMYLSDGNTESFSMNSALNTYLQSEINSIAGSALKTVDLSVGLDQSADASGETHTDYSFKFSKRLWNNRVNFVIGGKISGSDSSTDENDSFLDNVSLEYRLDQSAMRYLKVYYDKAAYDLLEGSITEYGGGFIWKKKADTFRQLFNFRSKDKTTQTTQTTPATADTLTTDNSKTATDITNDKAATDGASHF